MLELVVSPPKLRLLRYLHAHDGSFTGRELARAVGSDPKNVLLALKNLVETGVVHRRRAGKAYLYSLNRANYIVSDILVPAFQHEKGRLETLGAEVAAATKPAAESVILYGSWVRGRGGSSSDIDLLVVIGPKARKDEVEEKLSGLRAHLTDRFGHPPSFLVMTKDDFRRRVRRGNSLVGEIVEQGRVLAGRPMAELIGRA